MDAQWAVSTTVEEYLDDLRWAASHPSASLAVYTRRGGYVAVMLAPTEVVVPPPRRASGSRPNLLVVLSADRGTIVTGYQFTDRLSVGIPEDARWLR